MTERPIKDLKSIGFLDNYWHESKERTELRRDDDHEAVWSNYAQDLYIKIFDNLMTIFLATASFTWAAATKGIQNAIRRISHSIWINLFVNYYDIELITT